MPKTPEQVNTGRLIRLGNDALQRGDSASAVEAFRAVIETAPESAAVYHSLGVAHYKEGDFDKAKAALHRAAELNPGGSGPPFVLGLIARDERDYAAAHTAFSETIERAHGDWRAYANRGIVHFYLDEHESAIGDLRRSKPELVLENALLRKQLSILGRQVRRPRIQGRDRLVILTLARLLPNWRDALLIVKPATVLGWHRRLFKIYWRRKSRPRPPRLTSAPVGPLGVVSVGPSSGRGA